MPQQPDRLWARLRTSHDLGRFLAEVRIHRGLTQEELADDLGIRREYLSALEAGRSTKYADRLFALLAELGIGLTAEATDDDEPRARTFIPHAASSQATIHRHRQTADGPTSSPTQSEASSKPAQR